MTRRAARIAVVAVLWLLIIASLATTGAAEPGAVSGPSALGLSGPPPRLVVVISIDQFRADYLTRFADLWLPAVGVAGAPGQEMPGKVGGFRYLMERGAYFTDARHDHYPLFTGPGHAVLLTGAPPYKSGIVGNAWYDRELGRRRYCVEDDASPVVGAATTADARGAAGTADAMGATRTANASTATLGATRASGEMGTTGATRATDASSATLGATRASRPGVSPATLRVSTVGDELKMATGGRAKVWGLALKDRAAVLMAGRMADGALWFDDESGAWISSRFYRPDGTLPPWVAAWNAERHADAWFGKQWTLSVPAAALARVWTPRSRWAAAPSALGADFPHRVDGGGNRPGKDFYNAFATTPFGNDFTLDMARELVRREKLGQGEVPDLLAINLSSNDYVGHAYGPDSPEVLDAAVRTDRQLADFFAFLDQAVPGGLGGVLLAVTADHGVAPVPGAAREAKLPAGAFDEEAVAAAAERALQAAYGPGKWVTALVEANLYLDLAALDAHQVQHAAAEDVAAAAVGRLPGIYGAYGRTRILEGRLPRTDVGDRIERSFHPRLSGDVVLVSEPFWVPGKLSGTTHGTPYAYDTHVPLLLAGPGIRPGRYAARVSTLDLAPTLADLLGLLPPAGSEGRILAEAER
jgi:predicted AlkP superfamily pyrophosphatase or phosphodiesterase